MENNAELVRLEGFVDSLLTKYNDLKARYHSLEATLQERDNECDDLKANVAELNDERSAVGNRVSGLLGRIEQWESEQDEPVSGESDEQGVQGALFDNEAEATQ